MKRLLLALLTTLLVLPLAVPQAALGQSRPAMGLEDVLLTDAYSDIDRRESLEEARAGKDVPPAVWWQSGFMRSGDSWISYEESAKALKNNSAQAEYARLLRIAPDGAEGHVQLAKWCLQNDRQDQYRAHMLAAFRTNPSLATEGQFKRMGFVNLNGQWFSPESVYDVAKQRQVIDESMAQWGDACRRIRIGLGGTKTEVTRAEQHLAEIHSPDAVLALDNELGPGDARCHRLLVEALGRIKSATSTLTLAKYAVFSSAATARSAALQHLNDRSLSHFVPTLLGLLTTKAQVEFYAWEQGLAPGSLMGFTEFASTIRIVRETRNRRHISQLESVSPIRVISAANSERGGEPDFRHQGRKITPNGQAKLLRLRTFRAISSLQAMSTVTRKVSEADSANSQLNERVVRILSTVSGEEPNPPPEFWWEWWTRYTDVESPIKVEVLEVERRQIATADQTIRVSASCFAAGTPVLTETGRRPIEALRIGDRVLSQDIDTGELRLRAVQDTTVRPPRTSMSVSFGSETITCTGGHNFWKAGAGWTKARDLQLGDRIRTPTRTETVTATSTAKPAKTYNLVVEGFHTYFVGESALLVQDVLPPRATDMILPGLSRFDAPGED